MKTYAHIIPCGFLTAILTTAAVAAPTEIVRDTFAGDDVTRQSLGWYFSGTADKVPVSATGMTGSSIPSNLYFQNTTGILWKAFSSVPVNETTSVTLSLEFRDVGGAGFRIGLFSDGGTAAPTTDGAGSTNLNNDFGTFLIVKQTGMQLVRDDGTNGSIFYGTDRTAGESKTYSALSSTLHTLSLTLSQTGGTLTMTALLDGVHETSLASTDPKFATINELVLAQVDGTTGNFRIGNVTLTKNVIPEPASTALLSGLLMLAARGAIRRLQCR
ncbi:hypothetical protein OpiT1DRAFT_00536 [Opitutaceae bacterium TAV1]|nr:hypothetical protein OpiT1DRAFT_00536 [Opitutaceae bacterium TAV1]